jgi:glutamate synthase domain-containing protein 3
MKMVAEAIEIDAQGMDYKRLNALMRQTVNGDDPPSRVILRNVCGQRYIGTDLTAPVEIEIHGTPGNDLGSFMNGQRVIVYGNVQDGCGNTMNDGEVVVHGHAGDITGFSMRGGRIYVRDGVGYRVGIHMKEYEEKLPVLVIGGSAQDFLGEYMAGGRIIILGLDIPPGAYHTAKFVGTGMHNGAIFIRGLVHDYRLGKEVGVSHPGDDHWTKQDSELLRQQVTRYTELFGGDVEKILKGPFIKLYAKYLRPYGLLYSFRH